MKARFLEQQPPVKIVQADGKTYIFICQNETQGTESYEDNEEQIQETYYEYDYNEICGPQRSFLWKISRHIQKIIWIMRTQNRKKRVKMTE